MRRAERAQRLDAAVGVGTLERAQPARGLEQPRGLQLAALQVALDRHRAVLGVLALQQLARGQRRAGVRERPQLVDARRCAPARRTRARTAGRRSRWRSSRPADGRDRRVAAAQLRRRRSGRRGRAWPSAPARRPRQRARRRRRSRRRRPRPPARAAGAGACRRPRSSRRRARPAARRPGGDRRQALLDPAHAAPRRADPPRARRPRRPSARVAAHRPLPDVDRDDAARGQHLADPPEARALQLPASSVGTGEALHRVGQVAVGVGLPGGAPEHGHQAVEPHPVEPATAAAAAAW